MGLPTEFFTKESILTFSGAVTATFIIPNALQKALNFNPRWLALAVAMVFCFTGTYSAKGEVIDYLLAVVNGCLVYLSAVGSIQAVGQAPEKGKRVKGIKAQTNNHTMKNIIQFKTADVEMEDYEKRSFLTKWF